MSRGNLSPKQIVDHSAVPGNVPKYDTDGTLIDSGSTPGGGGGGGGNGGDILGHTWTTPPSTGWSWDNQAGASEDFTFTYQHLYFPRIGATNLVMRYRTAPTPPYIITALILGDVSAYGNPGATGDACEFGLGFRDGSGKVVRFSIGYDAGPNLITQKWTTTTSGPTNYRTSTNNPNYNWFSRPTWMRMQDDNTNLIFSLSIDGDHWNVFDTRSRTDHFASGPTQYGIVVYPNGNDVEMSLLSLKET